MSEIKEIVDLPLTDERLQELVEKYRDVSSEIATLKQADLIGFYPAVQFDPAVPYRNHRSMG